MSEQQAVVGESSFGKRIREAFFALADRSPGQWHAVQVRDDDGVLRPLLCMAPQEPGEFDLRMREVRSCTLQQGKAPELATFVYGLTAGNQIVTLMASAPSQEIDKLDWLLDGMPVPANMELNPLALPTTVYMLPTARSTMRSSGFEFDSSSIPDRSIMLEQNIWPCGRASFRFHLRREDAIYTTRDRDGIPAPEETPHFIAALVNQADLRLTWRSLLTRTNPNKRPSFNLLGCEGSFA